jgi:Flp pilus assembly protein TadG
MTTPCPAPAKPSPTTCSPPTKTPLPATNNRHNPIPDSEKGYVTAETALLLPVLLGIGYALALVVLIAADQIRCGDAAWEAARALARGVSSAQLSDIAARYAPAGAHTSAWSKDGSLTVEVDRDQSIASRFLPSIRISATATVPCEPRVDDCQIESNDIPGRPNG